MWFNWLNVLHVLCAWLGLVKTVFPEYTSLIDWSESDFRGMQKENVKIRTLNYFDSLESFKIYLAINSV